MNRRESIKSMLVGTLAGGVVITSCSPADKSKVVDENQQPLIEDGVYGRTAAEKLRDEKLNSEQFFLEPEMLSLAVLCDLILPPNEDYSSASDAGVPEFIEFIAKDMQKHQIPLRGGLMWLNNYANRKFASEFAKCEIYQQKQILDEIAYPDSASPELLPGVTFFSLLRNLTLTGFYTSAEGIKELNYQGNIANVWDGIPDEILAEHNVEYDEEWLAKCINQDTRNVQAEWDQDGNLLT